MCKEMIGTNGAPYQGHHENHSALIITKNPFVRTQKTVNRNNPFLSANLNGPKGPT